MGSPFSFILIVGLIGLSGLYFFDRGYSKMSPLPLFLSTCMFFLLSAIMFTTGIPDQSVFTNLTINSTASKTIVSYVNLTAANDGLVSGLAYFFLLLTTVAGLFTFYSLFQVIIRRVNNREVG